MYFSLWPLGGVQQQNGPNNDFIPEGTLLGFTAFLDLFLTLCSRDSRLCRQMADAGGQPQLTQVTSHSNSRTVKRSFPTSFVEGNCVNLAASARLINLLFHSVDVLEPQVEGYKYQVCCL